MPSEFERLASALLVSLVGRVAEFGVNHLEDEDLEHARQLKKAALLELDGALKFIRELDDLYGK